MKPRPSGWWFVVGVVLLVAAVAVGAALFLRTLSGFTDVDAAVPADGAPHEVEVGTDGDRFLWVAEDAGAARCAVVDGRTGEDIALEPVPGEFTRSAGAAAWRASARFDPGSGDLEVTCADSGRTVEIGPAVALGSFVGSVVLAIVLPLLLGLAGFAVLLVTGILWASRPGRAST